MHDIIRAMVSNPYRDPRLAPAIATVPSGDHAVHMLLAWVRIQRIPHAAGPLELSLFEGLEGELATLIDGVADLGEIFTVADGWLGFRSSLAVDARNEIIDFVCTNWRSRMIVSRYAGVPERATDPAG